MRLLTLTAVAAAAFSLLLGAEVHADDALRIVPAVWSPGSVAEFSPDGRYVATTNDFVTSLWDVPSGMRVRTFEGLSAPAIAAETAFSPDSRQLALVVNRPGYPTIEVWDLASGDLVRTLDRPPGDEIDRIFPLHYSPDGRRIDALLNNGSVVSWDVATGRATTRFDIPVSKGEWPIAGKISANGRYIAYAEISGNLSVWAMATGALASRLTIGSDADRSNVRGLAISPDGARVLSVAKDQVVRLWDVRTATVLWSQPINSYSAYLDFLDDGRRFRIGNQTFDSTTFQPMPGTPGELSDDGRLLLTWDGQLFKPNPLAPLGRRLGGVQEDYYSVDYALGDNLVVASSRNHLAGIAPATGEIVRSFDPETGPADMVSVSPDGRSMMVLHSKTHTVAVHDIESGRLVSSVELPEPDGGFGFSAISFTPDGKSGAASGYGFLRIWDIATGRIRSSIKSFGSRIAFSPDGRRVVVGISPKTYRIKYEYTGLFAEFDAASGKLLHTLPGNSAWMQDASYSPDGRYLATLLDDGHVSVWDAKSGRLARSLATGSGVDRSLFFSQDGSRLYVLGDNGTEAWEPATGARLWSTPGATYRGSLSPDGRLIVATGVDGTIRRFATADGRLLTTTYEFAAGDRITITPEGFFDTVGNGANLLAIVRGSQVFAIDKAYQALYRPDLVLAALAGDPEGKVRDAAAKLDLDKVIGSGGAPKVAITSPSAGADVDADSVEVEASVTDQGGGIGRIEWRVNGVTLGIDGRGFDRLDPAAGQTAQVAPGKTVTVKQKLSLDPGENIIEVVAYNEKGLIASDPASLTVKWEGATASTPPKLYVLAIGVNDYWDSRLKLTYAASDATAIGEAFKKSGEKLYSGVEVTTVLDAEATAANLDKVFAGLSARVHPRDVFVFFLAGHGKTEDGRYYFLPQDFRYEDESSIAKGGIDQEKFQAWFATIAARKSVLLYDTCDSGSLTKSGIAARGLEQVAALARMTRAMGRTVLSASTDDAPALEGYRNHGVFTYALLEALGSGDANHDGTIEVTELAGAIDKSVPDISYAAFKFRQVPQMSIVGSDFPLAEQTAVLADAPAATISTAPTHVVVAPATVRETAGAGANGPALTAGTLVTVVGSEGEWSLVARNGQKLGFIETARLAPIQ